MIAAFNALALVVGYVTLAIAALIGALLAAIYVFEWMDTYHPWASRVIYRWQDRWRVFRQRSRG